MRNIRHRPIMAGLPSTFFTRHKGELLRITKMRFRSMFTGLVTYVTDFSRGQGRWTRRSKCEVSEEMRMQERRKA